VLELNLDSTSLQQLTAADLTGPDTRRTVLSGGAVVGVLLGERDLAALQDTLAVLATVGAREAIAEGLADLAAGRADDWAALRADYGRGEPEHAT
jgi:PHD/YefM family antitoxin component YafN of YafNO toxin-antitoxin module